MKKQMDKKTNGLDKPPNGGANVQTNRCTNEQMDEKTNALMYNK